MTGLRLFAVCLLLLDIWQIVASHTVAVGHDIRNRSAMFVDARRTYLELSTSLISGRLLKFKAYVNVPDTQTYTGQFGIFSTITKDKDYNTEYVQDVVFESIDGIQEYNVTGNVTVEKGWLFGVTFNNYSGVISNEVCLKTGHLGFTAAFTVLPAVNKTITITYTNYYYCMSLQVVILSPDDDSVKIVQGPPGPPGLPGPTGPVGPPGPMTPEDPNQCQNNNGGCDTWCLDSDHGFECKCDPGYKLSANMQTCSNVDECVVDNGGCNHVCTDSPGGFTCSCHPGFSLSANNIICEDIDECRNATACPTGICVNYLGSYTCLIMDIKAVGRAQPLHMANDDEGSATFQITAIVVWLSLLSLVVTVVVVFNLSTCRKLQRAQVDCVCNLNKAPL